MLLRQTRQLAFTTPEVAQCSPLHFQLIGLFFLASFPLGLLSLSDLLIKTLPRKNYWSGEAPNGTRYTAIKLMRANGLFEIDQTPHLSLAVVQTHAMAPSLTIVYFG